jgi:hypothetical protein
MDVADLLLCETSDIDDIQRGPSFALHHFDHCEGLYVSAFGAAWSSIITISKPVTHRRGVVAALVKGLWHLVGKLGTEVPRSSHR